MSDLDKLRAACAHYAEHFETGAGASEAIEHADLGVLGDGWCPICSWTAEKALL